MIHTRQNCCEHLQEDEGRLHLEHRANDYFHNFQDYKDWVEGNACRWNKDGTNFSFHLRCFDVDNDVVWIARGRISGTSVVPMQMPSERKQFKKETQRPNRVTRPPHSHDAGFLRFQQMLPRSQKTTDYSCVISQFSLKKEACGTKLKFIRSWFCGFKIRSNPTEVLVYTTLCGYCLKRAFAEGLVWKHSTWHMLAAQPSPAAG